MARSYFGAVAKTIRKLVCPDCNRFFIEIESAHKASNSNEGQMAKLKLVTGFLLLIFIALFILVFLLQNQQTINIVTLFGEFEEVNLGQALALVCGIGAITGFFVGFLPGIMDALRIKRLQKEVKSLENELNERDVDAAEA